MYQPNLPRPDPRPSAPNRRRTRANVVDLNHISQAQANVSQLPQPHPVPTWLKSLLTIQRGTGILFGSVFGSSMIVYGYTVYTQDLWRHQHGQLQRLQVQERQQGVMDENLKHQMAEAAEQPNSGLVSPTPKQLVFIPSSPSRPTKSAPKPTQSKPASAPKAPLGY
jgi:hypothetical protein